MAIKTFTTGEVLTAADTNTYLANSGLVYVSSTTIGSGVTSVTVSNCFSSTYDSYRILIEVLDTNGTASHSLQFSGITGSSYFVGGSFGSWTVGTQTGYGPAAQTSFISSVNNVAGTGTVIIWEIVNPNVARRKYGTIFSQAGNGHASFNAYSTSTSTATGFVLSKASDTMTGGTITVYGYRKG